MKDLFSFFFYFFLLNVKKNVAAKFKRRVVFGGLTRRMFLFFLSSLSMGADVLNHLIGQRERGIGERTKEGSDTSGEMCGR